MIRINLLSDREAIRKESTRQQVSIYVLSICLLLVILGGIQFYQVQKKHDQEERIRDIQQALNELKKKVGEVEKYKEAKRQLETKLGIIERLQEGKLFVAQLLDKIGETIPDKMWLEELELKNGKLSMKGFAVDNETIAAFMKELERMKLFRTVELLLTEQKEVAGVGMKHFALMATVLQSSAEQDGGLAKKQRGASRSRRARHAR